MSRRIPRGGMLALLCLGLACAPVAGCRGRPSVPILTWHEVGPAAASPRPAAAGDADGWRVPEPLFLAQLDALQQRGFQTITLRQLFDHDQRGAPLPPHPVVLTFDDGTEDHLTRVLPALQQRGMRATFFVVAGALAADEASRHVEQGPEGQRRFLLASEVVQLQRAGMEIGSHGLHHVRLPELEDAEALAGLRASRSALAEVLGTAPDFFAYPYNSLRARHRALVREAGFRGAVAGVVHGDGDPWSLLRLPVIATTTPEALVRGLP